MRYQTLFEETYKAPELLKKVPNLKDLYILNGIYKNAGYELRLVGGCVRDIIQDKMPKDIDMCTNATPEQSKKILNDHNIRTIDTGLSHGTISAVINKEVYEITTLRIDTSTDGRHATVAYTNSFRLDAERRDLTMNSLSLDLDGNLYDYYGGVQDLKNHVIKFVGDTNKRIQEDYLRILRYFRFLSKLPTINVDDEIILSIKNNAHGLENISGERIWSEISKTLLGNNLPDILRLIYETDVAKYISFPRPEKSLKYIELIKSNNPITYLAFLTNDQQEINNMNAHWKFKADDKALLEFLVNNKEKNFTLNDLKTMLVNKISKEYVLELCLLKNEYVNEIKNWNIPVFPVSGQDLMQMGHKPGLSMGNMLKELKNKWIQSDYKLTKDDLLKLISN